MDEGQAQIAFAALSQETRLRILRMLTFMVGRNRSASEADAAKPTPRAEEDR